jgi:hypothetical protein
MSDSEIAAAEQSVAEMRRLASGGTAHARELATALLELSRALDQGDRTRDACAAAREGVEVLSPLFLSKPAHLADPMRALVTQYVALAQRLREPPDAALLAPVADALGAQTRAEDAAEEDEQ